MLAAAPKVYYMKDHYEGYSAVLVRLSRIEPNTLRDLLRGGIALDREEGNQRSVESTVHQAAGVEICPVAIR
jgi:hypothetical protein